MENIPQMIIDYAPWAFLGVWVAMVVHVFYRTIKGKW